MTTTRRRKVKRSTNKKQPLPLGVLLIGGAAVVVALVAILVSLNQSRARTVDAGVYKEFPSDWIQRNALGNPDAPVIIQTWEDFLCPACAQWATTIKPRLVEEYVKTGKVKLEFHHFPLSQHEPAAGLGAQASECAADQNAFWPYHDQLFQASAAQGENALTLDRLLQYADDLGLDGKQFSQCMNSQKYWQQVQQSATQAIAMSLNSTPSILVNGQLMDNPFDYGTLSAQIDRLAMANNQ